MKTAFMVHGAYGNSSENWFPWLKNELKKKNYNVVTPNFPTPKDQSLSNWLHVYKKYEMLLDHHSIAIGHSVGASFLLSLLEERKFESTFLVSGFLGLLQSSNFDQINKTFTTKKFDWDKIKKNCKSFFIFHSDNDPYVPLNKATELAECLGCQPIIIKGAGHFNEASGYVSFKPLLNKITKL